MKYQELWSLCEQCLEGFENLPPTSCITIDDHIEATIDKYNTKVAKDIERQQTLQASSAKTRPGEAAAANAIWKEKTLSSVVQTDEIMFIRETVSGVFNNKDMLMLAFEAYREGMKRNRQNCTALLFVTYLLLFRYEEIGGETFRQLIDRCAPYPKLAEFIGFLLNRSSLDAFVVPRWRTSYDDVYTEEVLVGSLLGIKEDVTDSVLNWLQKKGTNLQAAKEQREQDRLEKSTLKSPTVRKAVVKSPQVDGQSPLKPHSPASARVFTNRRGEQIPPFEVREMIHLEPLAKLPRIADRATTPEREAVVAAKKGEKRSTLHQEVRERNREKEQNIAFRSFSATQRPTNLPRLQAEQRQRDQLEMQPVFTNRPGPEEVRRKLESINDNVDVRTTNATLLREEVLYAKKAEEEELALKRKIKDLRDDSEFVAWKRKGEEEDDIQRRTEIAQRKADMMLVDAEAKAARIRQTKRNQSVSRHFRAQAEVDRRRNEKEAAKKKKQLLENAKQIRVETDNAAKVKDKVAEANAKLGREMLERKQEDEMKIATALELERERKQELIRRIKEVHEKSVAIAREQREKKRHINPVDLGELVAMTYDQLQDALTTVRQEHDALVEARRERINATRAKEKDQRENIQQRILVERQRHRDRKAAAREQKRAEELEKQERLRVIEEKRLIELQEKLQATREDRAHVLQERREEDRQRRLAAQLLSADANAVERLKWEEMYRGTQNTIVHAQNQRLQQNRVDRKRVDTITTLRETNIDTTHTTRMASLHERDSAFQQRKAESQRDAQHDEAVLVEAYARMKEEKKKRSELMAKLP